MIEGFEYMESEISGKIGKLNPPQFLDYYTGIIDERIKAYSSRIVKEAGLYHPFIREAAEGLGEFLLRKGKRIASCSTLLTYQGYAGGVDEDILRICLAIELYRHSILVHDDLIDMDDSRRGGKALHKLFSDGYDERFGEGIAILYGNILYSETLTTLLNTGFETSRLLRATGLLSKSYRDVNESQVLDLLLEYKEPTLREWEAMASKRAASLFKLNMLTGAILGEAAEKELGLIEESGRHIGLSFDIQDDIIGTYASPEEYGRPTGGDIILGKKPLHVIYAHQMAHEREREELRRLLAGKELDKKEIERVKGIIRSCGALEKAKLRSKEHAQKAIETLNKTSMTDHSKTLFSHLITYISESLDWYQ